MKIARRQLGLFILLFAVSSLLVHSPPGAFAANGDITNVRSMTGPTYPFEHDLSQGKHNSLVQVDSDTYALAYSGVDDDGFISTFTISSDGATITEVDSLEHDTDTNSHPIQKNGANSLVKVDSDTFALAYTGADEDGFISTFTIDSDGNITAVRTQSEGNNLQHDTSKGWNNSLVKVDSDTVALAYTDVWGDGIIKTFTISSDGTTITQVESLEHDTSSNADNSLVHVDSDIFALAYNGAGQDGFISTFSIDSDGDITAIKTQSEGNNFEYDDRYGYHNSLVKVDSDTVLLAYMYSWEGMPYGKFSSFTIDSDGNITEVINSSTFEIRSIKYISVLQVDSDTYAVAWTNYQGFGKLTTMTINPDGTYPSQSRPLLIFDNYNSFNSLVKVDSDTIALASAGAGDDGLISTFGIGGDTTAPTVTITSSTGSSGDTVSDTTLSFTATFSEFTSNFVVGDITVTGTANGSSPAASNFAGSGTTYTFDVVKGSSDGTVSVSVAADKATDAAGNDNTVSNTYALTIDTTVTSSGASTQGTSCFASPRCAIISVPDGFSINEKSYTLFKNTHTLPTYEAIVGQPVTITLKIPVTSELLQIMSTTIYVEIFNSFEDYEDAARIKYSLTDETIQYTNQSIFEVVGAKNESKLIKLSKDYPENVPESQIPAINFVEITFTMIFAKPMDTSHVVIETEGNYNMHEIIYLKDALVVKENSLNALTLDEISKIQPELVYDPLPFVDPLKEPSHYIKRYLSEPEYKEWFDTNYPSYTIYEGIGISKYEFDEIVKQLTSPEPLLNNYQGSVIPEWVKNNAAWWSEGVIYDNDFVSGIEFLIKEGIIMVSVTESGEKSDAVIPEWVKNNAAWWSEDIISEKEFLSGIEYLVNNGIIQVN